MSEVLPKYLMKSYILLRKNFKDKEFTCAEAKKVILKSDVMVSVTLNSLRKKGWIDAVGLDAYDLRKIIYQIYPIGEILDKIN